MNKEDIKNEAASYVEDILGLDYIGESEAERAFIAGASWRINSVWHDAKEKPEEDRSILVELGNGTCCMFYNRLHFETKSDAYHINREVDAYRIIRWAYVEDLLPERKEDTE